MALEKFDSDSIAQVEDDASTVRSMQVSASSSRKVLEEEEYLDRMSKIIKRDFFAASYDPSSAPSTNPSSSVRDLADTPGTARTDYSSTSSMRSRQAACSMRLNDFLERYTSEDNDYFEKIQSKELRRHKSRFPWLYNDKDKNNDQVRKQLILPSSKSRLAITEGGKSQLVTWPHDPKNALFNPTSQLDSPAKITSTVNYESSKYIREPIFKEPHSISTNERPRSFNKFKDRIGIDGRTTDGSETPSVNGFSFVPPPDAPRLLPHISDTPATATVKVESNRYFIPHQSPRDDLAHRLYEEKVAKKIRTPSSRRNRGIDDSTRSTQR